MDLIVQGVSAPNSLTVQGSTVYSNTRKTREENKVHTSKYSEDFWVKGP